MINFCIKCFKGFMLLDHRNQKGWGIKCDNCKFRIQILENAMKVSRDDTKCVECDSYTLSVSYKDKSPFPGSRT